MSNYRKEASVLYKHLYGVYCNRVRKAGATPVEYHEWVTEYERQLNEKTVSAKDRK